MNQLLVATRAMLATRDRMTSVLTVVAFALPHAVLLAVLGGLLTFIRRFDAPANPAMEQELYVALAWFATALLLVPAATMGGAAARLGLSRRAVDLARLRLIGVTPLVARGACVVQTCCHATVGVVAGSLLYALTLPAWSLVTFQQARLLASEMWVGPVVMIGAGAAMVALASVSSWIAMRAAAITALGVARNSEPRKVPVIPVVLSLGLLLVWLIGGSRLLGLNDTVATTALVAFTAATLALTNVVGTWTVGIFGRIIARMARSPQTLLAGRRLVDDPRAVWRSYGSLPLVAFVAGVMYPVLEILASVPPSPYMPEDVWQVGQIVNRDMVTGITLTLVIVFVLAAISTAVNQSIRAIDQAAQTRALHRAGASPSFLARARRIEVSWPALAMVGGAMLAGTLVMVPAIGSPGVLGAVGAAVLLALTGTALVLVTSEVAAAVGRRARKMHA